MHDTELYNYYIADELPNDDDMLQEVLDYSFEQNEIIQDELYMLAEDMESNVNNIFATATTISITEIDNIFKNKNLKVDECSICINNDKLMKCYQCVGHICKSCTTNIYRRHNHGNIICPFCNQVLDLKQLQLHNRNVYSTPSTTKKQHHKQKQKQKSNSTQYKNNEDDRNNNRNMYNIEEQNLQYALENADRYANYDYNSGSSDIEAFDYDDSKRHEYSYNKSRVGFTTSMYGYDHIEINPINKNRKKIMFPNYYYNCKYLLILYLILLKYKSDNEWNDFVTRFMNQINNPNFKNSSYRKKFLWDSYVEILL